MNKKLLPLLLLSFIYASQVVAQRVNRRHFIQDSLDSYVNQALSKWRIPGAAVCIVKDGKVVVMKGYGVKEWGKPDKVDENTLFMIGSNTKAVTAIALAMLEEEKKLSLDDKVTKYIPGFKLANKLAGEEAMIRDLLCHRLGFETFQGDFTYWTSNLSRPEVMAKMSHVKALYPFRTKWGYNNAAFLTAGEIIPKVTGQPWETFIKDRIFTPLGMTSTLALSKDLPAALNKATAHTFSDNQLIQIPYAQIDNLAPAGSISSSVNDMSKWVQALLPQAKPRARPVIPTAAITATTQPHSFVGNANHPSGNSYLLYGLGWFLEDYLGRRLFRHTGGVNGFVSSVTVVPGENLGIVVLTNTDQNNFFAALNWEILDAYLHQPFRNYSQAYLTGYHKSEAAAQLQDKAQRDSVARTPLPVLPLKAFTGQYTNELYGNVTITQPESHELQMTFEHHPDLLARLQFLGRNRFYVRFSDPTFGQSAVFTFKVQDSNVIGVKVKVADFVEITPYEFTKML